MKSFFQLRESIVVEGEGIVTKKKMVGEPEPGSYAYERKYGKYTAKGELRKRPNPNKPPVKDEVKEAVKPGWMLKKDPELAKKVKEKEELHKTRVKAMGNPAAGKSVKEEAENPDRVTTHENPLVTVHNKYNGKWELHTHANLSVANRIFQTKVKHSDVHKGPVEVKSGGSYGNVKFAISKHHAAEMEKDKM